MTIYEFCRCIPMGSRVRIVYWNQNRTKGELAKVGVVFACQYSEDRAEHGGQHIITLKDDHDKPWDCRIGDVAYVDILSLPEDYECAENGITVSNAAKRLYQNFNDMMDYSKMKDFRFAVKEDFCDQIMQIVPVMEQCGLISAAQQLCNLAGTNQFLPMPDFGWYALFEELAAKRTEVEQLQRPERMYLRRGEALLCCFGYKKHPNPNVLRYVAELTLINLIEQNAVVLPPEAYAERHSEMEQALDWFLMANVYRLTNMQESCTYVALVQSILHRGALFDNQANRRLFIYMCGSAHDFTFLRQLLGRTCEQNGERDSYPGAHLANLGRLMCWMLYQLGGSGVLDAMELLPAVVAQNNTTEQYRQLQERMLTYTCKYAPRNRNDRFMAVSNAMRILLQKLQSRDVVLQSENQYGYIYEFHGTRGAYLNEVNGHILGANLLPYRFSYSMDTYDIQAPLQLQNKYDEANMDGSYLLVPVYFSELPPNTRKSRLGATNLQIIPKGDILL